MATKYHDLCLDKVAEDEPIFVLRAQDITMNRPIRILVTVLAAAGLSGVLLLSGVEAQTVPPGMMLVDCPVRPSPWEAPSLAGHAGFDLNLDPSSAVPIPRGVPAQCIAYPGGSQRVFEQIIGLRVYVPRHGTDPGSQTGALAQAVAIRDNNAGTWNTTEQEFWATGQDWRDYVSDDGRWVYSIRGGLDPDPSDWRRWPRLVKESDLLARLPGYWAKGGQLGMPDVARASSTPVVASSRDSVAVTSVPMPTIQATSGVSASTTPTPNPVEARLTELERRQAEDRSLLRAIHDLLVQPTPGVVP